MNPLAFIPIIGEIIDRVIPDTNARNTAKEKLSKMALSGDLQVRLGQIAINLEEAKHPSIFVSGWRPATGWVCAFGLLYQTVLVHVIPRVAEAPDIDTSALISLLGALLGLGGILRTIEKAKGVARNSIKGKADEQ